MTSYLRLSHSFLPITHDLECLAPASHLLNICLEIDLQTGFTTLPPRIMAKRQSLQFIWQDKDIEWGFILINRSQGIARYCNNGLAEHRVPAYSGCFSLVVCCSPVASCSSIRSFFYSTVFDSRRAFLRPPRQIYQPDKENTMKNRLFVLIGVVVLACGSVQPGHDGFQRRQARVSRPRAWTGAQCARPPTILRTWRQPEAAGYGMFLGCVGGPQEGPWASIIPMAH